jgi:hypothetical protein
MLNPASPLRDVATAILKAKETGAEAKREAGQAARVRMLRLCF